MNLGHSWVDLDSFLDEFNDSATREIPHATPTTTFPLAWPCSK
jgi:hypothetical protein